MQPVDAWVRTLRAVAARGDVAGAGADVLGRYAEPHRSYHTVAHLADVLDGVEELADVAADLDVVRLAALFHDAVYDPLRADNEQRSADLAVVTLAALGVDARLVADVERLVLLTATHEPDPDDRDGAVLCDADLRVLGREPEGYAGYVAAVRREYGALDEPTWRSGRAAVLRRLLARPVLFSTARGQERYEARARSNLLAELAALTAGGRASAADAGPTASDGPAAPGR